MSERGPNAPPPGPQTGSGRSDGDLGKLDQRNGRAAESAAATPPVAALGDQLSPSADAPIPLVEISTGSIQGLPDETLGDQPSPPLTVTLGTARVTLQQVAAVAAGAPVSIDADASALLARSHAVVEAALAAATPVYGLNTELGAGRDTPVDPSDLAAFQRRIIANHCGGIGPALPTDEVRTLAFVRLAGFTRGGSGVRPALADAWAALLNAQIVPLVPARGSVGAADLTHLAAVAAVLTGTGHVVMAGEVVPGRQALKAAHLEPFDLAPGEALACLSSNAYSVGVGALELARLDRLSNAADRVVALSLEAIARRGDGGNLSPFDEAVARATGRRGQADAAASVLENLAGSITQDSRSVQDPLSFRTVPQLHGAQRDQLRAAGAEVETELNARSDNPLVDVETNRIISGGNFQVLSLAVQFDTLRAVLAHVASASERRISALSELARPDRSAGTSLIPGLLWYSAAANLAEIRQLAAPASVAGAALSGVEDQATYAPLALQLLQRSRALTLEIFAIEALHAAHLQGPEGRVVTGLETALRALSAQNLPSAALVYHTVQLLEDAEPAR